MKVKKLLLTNQTQIYKNSYTKNNKGVRMSFEINTKSFKIRAESDIEALDILLTLYGQDMAKFSDYMGVTDEDIIVTDDDGNKTVQKWAINYLTDVINAELIHLGYVAKDTKAIGMFGEYNDVQLEIGKQVDSGTVDPATIPVEIFTDEIITEGSRLKIRYVVNAETILSNFME